MRAGSRNIKRVIIELEIFIKEFIITFNWDLDGRGEGTIKYRVRRNKNNTFRNWFLILKKKGKTDID